MTSALEYFQLRDRVAALEKQVAELMAMLTAPAPEVPAEETAGKKARKAA